MRVSIVLLVTSSLWIPAVALAQNANPASPPATMSLEEAKSTIYAEDKTRALDAVSTLEEFAAQGNASAMLALGDMYGHGRLVEQDKDRAVSYYRQSADAGSGFATYRLAEAYRTGGLVEQDSVKAAGLYQQAAAKGVDDAKVRFAQALLNGEGVEQDRERGLATLNELADGGSQLALNSLGIYYASSNNPAGQDGEKAISYLERSSDLGNLYAKVRLAEVYADGDLTTEDDLKALDLLRQASDGGLTHAKHVRAVGNIRGRFGKNSNAKEGLKELTALANEENSESRIALADAYYWGIGTTRDVDRSLSLLREGAASGDVAAIQRLAMLLRDAPGKRIARDLSGARKLIDDASTILPPAARSREYTLLAAAGANSARDFEEVLRLLGEAPPESRTGIVAAIANTNPNAFVYAAQKRLQERGAYTGPLNGMLTRSTIRSMQSICDDTCRRGPLTPAAVRHLTERLYE